MGDPAKLDIVCRRHVAPQELGTNRATCTPSTTANMHPMASDRMLLSKNAHDVSNM